MCFWNNPISQRYYSPFSIMSNKRQLLVEYNTQGNTTVEPGIIYYLYELIPSSIQDTTSEPTPAVIPTKNSVDSPTSSISPPLQIIASWSEAGTTSVKFRPSTRNNRKRCDAVNCNRTAIIMCSVCKTAKYCSKKCQINDWYDTHEYACELL